MTDAPQPQRGEIWLVNLDPTLGAEIRKTRPAVVVSADGLGSLPVRIVAPITAWRSQYAEDLWHLPLPADKHTNLGKPSAVDLLQIRSLDTQRFVHRIGCVHAALLDEIAAAIALVVGYETAT